MVLDGFGFGESFWSFRDAFWAAPKDLTVFRSQRKLTKLDSACIVFRIYVFHDMFFILGWISMMERWPQVGMGGLLLCFCTRWFLNPLAAPHPP